MPSLATASGLCTPVNVSEILSSLPDAKRMKFAAGETVLKESTAASVCYLILKGRVQVSKRVPGASRPLRLAVMRRGDFIGEMAMLAGLKRTASAVALSAVEVLEVRRADFDALLQAHHPMATRLALHFACALAHRCSRILKLVEHPETLPSPAAPPRMARQQDVQRALDEMYSLWAI